MKKLFSVIFIAVIIFMLPINANASLDELYCDFDSDTDIRLNKGFNIYLNLKCNDEVKLSALRIDIQFDNTKLKFMSATSSENNNATINTSLINDNIVRLVYINEIGLTLSSQLKQICSIRFKPISEPNNTTYTFSAKILEAGTSDAEYFSVINAPSFSITSDGTVSINSNNHDESSSSNNSASQSNSKSSSKNNSSSHKNSSNNTDSENSDVSDNNGNNDISIDDRKQLGLENGFNYFLYGVFGTLILVGIAFAAYKLGRKSK